MESRYTPSRRSAISFERELPRSRFARGAIPLGTTVCASFFILSGVGGSAHDDAAILLADAITPKKAPFHGENRR